MARTSVVTGLSMVFVESKSIVSTASTSHTATLTAPVAGDLVVVSGFLNKAVFDMTGGTVRANASLSSGRSAFVTSRVLPESPSGVVEITSDTGVCQATVMQFRNVGSYSSSNTNNNGSGQTSWQPGSVTVPANGLVVASVGLGSAQSSDVGTWNSSMTTILDGTLRSVTGYRLTVPAGAFNPTASWTGSSDVAGAIACWSAA